MSTFWGQAMSKSTPPPELLRFDRLMRGLLRVPKTEVDAEGRKHQRRKSRKKRLRGKK